VLIIVRLSKIYNQKDNQKRKQSKNQNQTSNQLNTSTSSTIPREKSLNKFKLIMREILSMNKKESIKMDKLEIMPKNKIKREIDIINKTFLKEKDEKPVRKYSRNRPIRNLDKPEFSFDSKKYLSRSPSLNSKLITNDNIKRIRINNIKNMNESMFSTSLLTNMEYHNFEYEMKRKINSPYREKFAHSRRSGNFDNFKLK
jgi:hypothetical protein